MSNEFSPETWLDNSPRRYNAWKVVENTAMLISEFDTCADGEWRCGYWDSPNAFRAEIIGRCWALHIMSEYPMFAPGDWEQWIVWYAMDHYCCGKRVKGWTAPEDNSYPQPIF